MLLAIDPPALPPLVLAFRRGRFPASGFPASYGRKRSNIVLLPLFPSALPPLFSFSFAVHSFRLLLLSVFPFFRWPLLLPSLVARPSFFARCQSVIFWPLCAASHISQTFSAFSLHHDHIKKAVPSFRICAQQIRRKMICFYCC